MGSSELIEDDFRSLFHYSERIWAGRHLLAPSVQRRTLKFSLIGDPAAWMFSKDPVSIWSLRIYVYMLFRS